MYTFTIRDIARTHDLNVDFYADDTLLYMAFDPIDHEDTTSVLTQVENCISDIRIWIMSSGGLAVKHPALGANGHRFEPRKRSKPFQRLISRLTTSWVADHVKWRCRLHWIIKNKGGR